ncbi:MAG: M56 family metallopeptidase [Planctomycetota bacterium]
MTLFERWISLAEWWWPLFCSCAVQGALMALVAIVIVRRSRRLSSRIAYGILCLALLKFALPPVWSFPTGIFTHATRLLADSGETSRQPLGSFEGSQGTRLVEELSSLGTPVSLETSGPGEPEHRPEPILEASIEQSIPPRSFEAAEQVAVLSPARAEASSPLSALLLALYLTGAFWVALWSIRSGWRLHRLVRLTEPATDPKCRAAYRASLSRVRPWRTPRLLVAPYEGGPVAFGVMRPAVLIPESMVDSLSIDELETVFDHELTHHRHGDLWVSGCQLLLSIAWWFHPMIWILNRKIRETREDWCDDSVLDRRPGPTYCQTLLRVAANSSKSSPVAIAMSSGRESLERRFRRILTRQNAPSVSTWIGVLLIVGLAALFLPGWSNGTSGPEPSIPIADSGIGKEVGEDLSRQDETIVRGFRLENVDPKSLLTTLQELSDSSGSKLRLAMHGSTLFVRGTPEAVDDVRDILEKLDIDEERTEPRRVDASTFYSSRTSSQAVEKLLRDLGLEAEVRGNGIDGFFEVVGSKEARAAAREIARTMKPSGPVPFDAEGLFETTYEVQKGDTLAKISNQLFGTPRHHTRIAHYNGIDAKNLQIGQTLRIPPPSEDPVLVGLELSGALLRMSPQDPLRKASAEVEAVELLLSQPLMNELSPLRLTANKIQVEARQVRASLWIGLDRSPVRLMLVVQSDKGRRLKMELYAIASTDFPHLELTADRLVLSPTGGGPSTIIENGRILTQGEGHRSPVASVLTIIAEPNTLDGELSQGVVQLSLGAHHGVAVGDRFTVYREDRYIADAEVVEVEEFQSKARVKRTAEGQKIQVYDSASKDL